MKNLIAHIPEWKTNDEDITRALYYNLPPLPKIYKPLQYHWCGRNRAVNFIYSFSLYSNLQMSLFTVMNSSHISDRTISVAFIHFPAFFPFNVYKLVATEEEKKKFPQKNPIKLSLMTGW